MKIEIKKNAHKEFQDVQVGDIFVLNDTPFMKLTKIDYFNVDDELVNALDLDSQEFVTMESDDLVIIPTKAKLIIEL